MKKNLLARFDADFKRSDAFQAGAFLAVGLLQLAVDTALFVLLTSAGVAVLPANVAGRVTGAVLGFTLNGRITFAAAGGNRLDLPAFGRFALLWTALTVIGTATLMFVDARMGLTLAWLVKPVLEAVLAVFGFFGMKLFVFPAKT